MQRPVAGLGAAAYAASLAVGSPLKPLWNPSQPPSRGVSGKTRHAKLPSQQIAGMVSHGLRHRYSNLCPLVNDWEEHFLNDDANNIHARVYKSISSLIAVVAFRGTQLNSGKNWETDINIKTRRVELGADGHWTFVHDGFAAALDNVLPRVKKWVEGYINGTQGMLQVPPYWKLVFTGHSLGGALATLAATFAEAQNWKRKPDATITFGGPRIADGNLSKWWASHGLCDKLMRVNIYNDIVHWMPFTLGFKLLSNMLACTTNMQGCLGLLHSGLEANAKQFENGVRWTHVCPTSEFLVPGALKGVNPEINEFSPLGGVLAHFLGNAMFGYGYGMLFGGFVLHDEHCGLSPNVFPKSECSTVEDLSGMRCFGLKHDKGADSPAACKENCCSDPYCEVWQSMDDGTCWRGRGNSCLADELQAKPVVVGERIQ